MNYQKLIVVGNVTRDAQRRTSEKRDVAYTTFSVGVSDGKERSIFFPITVFGKHGEALAGYVVKGRQVLVEGRITMSASGRFNVVADRVVLGTPVEKTAVSPTPTEETEEKANQ